MYFMPKDKKWESKEVSEFKGRIESIVKLSNECMLIGGWEKDDEGYGYTDLLQVALKNGKFDPRGIEGFYGNIYSIAALPDGSALVGGRNGELCSTTSCFPTVEDLKSQLDEIIEKGEK